MIVNFLKWIQEFLNSNIGLVTFVVSFLVIYLYAKQKADKKRDAASLILQEIRFAEQCIRTYLEKYQYQLSDRLLPTNSWNDNVHIFINNLDQTELDLINRFYSKTAYIDVLIGKISDFKNAPIQMGQTVTPSQSVVIGSPPMSGGQPAPMVVPFDPLFNTQNTLASVSQSVEQIYNTPAGEKLKRIAKRKWYQLV